MEGKEENRRREVGESWVYTGEDLESWSFYFRIDSEHVYETSSNGDARVFLSTGWLDTGGPSRGLSGKLSSEEWTE